jgi:sigma-B regulation protein RsbU (phosphoserine phosphatase)
MACRASLHLPRLCILAASLGAAITGLPLDAQSFDATGFHEPVRIGVAGVVHDGDDPAYARPDFDDSKWLPVDAKTRLREYFPHSQSPIVWRRIHVKVDPGVESEQTGLALQAYDISRAFEVYVNGRKLIQSGQVDPYVAYTRDARLIARIPEEQLRTGSLVIAIRIRAPLTTWTSAAPGFRGATLMLGDESALKDKNLLSMIGEYAVAFLANLLSLGVGLVALALFLSQRQQREYLWIFVLGILNAAILPLLLISIIRNIPANWYIAYEILRFATNLAMILMVRAFLRKPFGRLLLLCTAVGCSITYAFEVAYLYGALPYSFAVFEVIPIAIVFAVVLPILLIRQLRRGDREAGILLIPFFFYSLGVYGFIGARLLQQIPPLRSAALRAEQLVFGIPLGMLSVGLGDLGILIFYFSLAILIVLRSARMSRQQGILEGEMAAAREVQQVILPEQVEAVPGFTVESVYQPAQQVGGDFFQILPAGDGGLLLVIGDVAGKGLPAAMLVSMLVGAIRSAAACSQAPEEILAQLNERLIGRTHGGFSTALAAHITADGWVTVANAGHLPPYLDGREVELPGALPLGIVSGASYETTRFNLPPGSRLTFYSDGVVEAQNQKSELFGFERGKAISTQPAAAIADAAKQFGQSDDITVVCVQRNEVVATAA